MGFYENFGNFFTKIYFNDLLIKFKIYIHNIKFFKSWYFDDFYKTFFKNFFGFFEKC